jgi:hypothetical protein
MKSAADGPPDTAHSAQETGAMDLVARDPMADEPASPLGVSRLWIALLIAIVTLLIGCAALVLIAASRAPVGAPG